MSGANEKLTTAQRRMLRDAQRNGGRMGVGFNAGRVRCAEILAEKGLVTIDFYGVTRVTLTAAGRAEAGRAFNVREAA